MDVKRDSDVADERKRAECVKREHELTITEGDKRGKAI